MQKPTHRQVILISFIVAILALGGFAYLLYFCRESIPPVEELRGQLLAFLQSIPKPVYFIAFVVLPAMGVPLTLFYLTALPVLGSSHPAIAILLGWTAVALNMALTYVLARSILHPVIEWVIRHRHLSIPKLKADNEWKVVLATRLSPVPFALQNYLLALGHARWRTYLWLSMLIQGSIGLAVMLVGESVMTGGLGYILLAVFVLLVLNLILDHFRKRLTREVDPSSE